MKKRFSLHQLEIIQTLARHQNMTRAADELNITTPAMSIQVKNLSQAIGMPLHEQVGRNLYLTEAGRIVENAAMDVLQRLDTMESEIADVQGLEKGTLKLSIISTAKYFIPHLLGEFCRQHPGIKVELEILNGKQCLSRLEKNLDDIYVLGQVPKNIDVVAVPFMNDPLVILCPADHPLAGQKNIKPSALNDEQFIMRENGSATRKITETFMDQHKINVRTRMTLGSNEAVKQAVAGGLGMAVLSQHTLRLDEASGAYAILDVKGFPLSHDWSALSLKKRKASPVSTAFLKYLTEQK